MFNSILLIILLKITLINCHARLLDPPARSTAWRYDSRFPAYYNDNEMFCGGLGVQIQNGGKCGICGENYAATKQFEKGGSMYRGYIVRTYSSGQVISVVVQLTANHKGYFEFFICNIDGMSTDATQDCLNKTPLKDINGNTKIYLTTTASINVTTSVKLPDSLTCNNCVFQWKYTAANSFGTDSVTGQSCVGCGAQEQFYGCSDIKIFGPATTTTTQTTSKVTTTTQKPTSTVTTTPKLTTTTLKPITSTQYFTTTTKKASNCNDGDGYYILPETGCRMFIVRANTGTDDEKNSIFECPEDTLFDEECKVCNWASKVTCKI